MKIYLVTFVLLASCFSYGKEKHALPNEQSHGTIENLCNLLKEFPNMYPRELNNLIKENLSGGLIEFNLKFPNVDYIDCSSLRFRIFLKSKKTCDYEHSLKKMLAAFQEVYSPAIYIDVIGEVKIQSPSSNVSKQGEYEGRITRKEWSYRVDGKKFLNIESLYDYIRVQVRDVYREKNANPILDINNIESNISKDHSTLQSLCEYVKSLLKYSEEIRTKAVREKYAEKFVYFHLPFSSRMVRYCCSERIDGEKLGFVGAGEFDFERFIEKRNFVLNKTNDSEILLTLKVRKSESSLKRIEEKLEEVKKLRPQDFDDMNFTIIGLAVTCKITLIEREGKQGIRRREPNVDLLIARSRRDRNQSCSPQSLQTPSFILFDFSLYAIDVSIIIEDANGTHFLTSSNAFNYLDQKYKDLWKRLLGDD